MKKDTSHEAARRIVEHYLERKGKVVLAPNFFPYPPDFVKKHKLEKRFKGHSFDIMTKDDLIEIDDYGKHSKKNQQINDGIVDDFVDCYLKPFPPGHNFYRLQKEEIVNEKGVMQQDATEYLKEHLF